MDPQLIISIIGFCLGAYAIVANDAIQTLGTFLASNGQRPWWVLWLFSCSILTVVIILGFLSYNGDVSYGRLDKIYEKMGGELVISWFHLLPPIALLILTRMGFPVSTSFLVLVAFAPGALGPMVLKSAMGYALSFTIGFLVYFTVLKYFRKQESHEQQEIVSSLGAPKRWIIFQWMSTGFLWSQWLIQDLANIYVFLPRQLFQAAEGTSPSMSNWMWLLGTLAVMLILHAVIFIQRGGPIQKVVATKWNTSDIRSATIIDLLFGMILLFFKEYSKIPMSTTWVFVGLLAGRQLGVSLILASVDTKESTRMVIRDALKVLSGLAVSILVAYLIRFFKTGTIGG